MTADPNDTPIPPLAMSNGLLNVNILNVTASSVALTHNINATWSSGGSASITAATSEDYTVAAAMLQNSLTRLSQVLQRTPALLLMINPLWKYKMLLVTKWLRPLPIFN